MRPEIPTASDEPPENAPECSGEQQLQLGTVGEKIIFFRPEDFMRC